MEIILLLIRIFLFGVFALAGIGKLLDLEGSEKAAKAFGTPEEFAKTFAIAIPFAEIVFAFCFLSVETSWIGAVGALLLLLSFIGGMIAQIAQGKAPDCHCFGQIHSEPVGAKTLVRNIVFAILAIFLVAQGRANQGMRLAETNTQMIQTVIGLLVLTALIIVVSYLKRMHDQHGEILRRLEMLEIFSTEGTAIERKTAGAPMDGLPIGAPFPDFELPDMGGRNVAFEHLLADGKPILFFFVSPSCQPCKAMLPEIDRWHLELREKLNFVFISSGSREENAEKFGASRQILLQKKREVAESVRARWTPTAIFVDSGGLIRSHSAAGDESIRALIEKILSEDLTRKFVHFTNGDQNGYKLRIGETIPEFALEDINGNSVATQDFLGRKTLAVFWSTTCPHCVNMMADLRDWDESRKPNEPELVVFSEGDRSDHLKFGLRSKIVLESGYATAIKLGMHGTPSAVLVNEEGIIASEPAIGAPNIWALLGRRPTRNNS